MADTARTWPRWLATLGISALLAGCVGPEPTPLWGDETAEAPAEAPAGDGWAFVAAGRYGDFEDEDDDEDERDTGGQLLGPTVVPAGYRGEGTSSERAFSTSELQRASFTGFSAPVAGAPIDAPNQEPRGRAAFQPLNEVPR